MATQATPVQLPFGVGRPGRRLVVTAAVLLALVGVGAFAYGQQASKGEVVTGLRDIGSQGGVVWGLYIVMDLYFVGLAFTGLALATLVRLMNLEHLRPVARMGLALTVVALVMAGTTVLADLGRPLAGIANLLLYARPESPFFGTFALVVITQLVAALVYLYLDGRHDAATLALRRSRLQGFFRAWAAGYKDTPEERRRHRVSSGFLAWVILPIIVVAFSTLGLVFGLQPGRPGWFSALQAPGLIMLGAASGTGLLAALGAVARGALGARDRIPDRVFAWLGNLMLALALGSLYVAVIEIIVGLYAPNAREGRGAAAILTGPHAKVLWRALTMLVVGSYILLLQAVTRRHAVGWVAIAGVLINLATVGKRYVTV